MINLSQPESVKKALHTALSKLSGYEQCALLDYPDYLNIGDHLIWLGTIFYLTDILKIKVNYIASVDNFSEHTMEQKVGKAPIFLQGGGNLGDLWPRYQQFREKIVLKYQDRPIIILPQSIYFENQDNLLKAAKVFNSHPDLTLFVRDDYSYKIATEYFTNCQIIKSPDMAFQLVDMPWLAVKSNQRNSVLYLCRKDKELNDKFTSSTIDLPNLVIQDWVSFNWLYRENLQNSQDWYWRLPGSVKIFRELWQKRLSHPPMYISRQIWQNFHPYSSTLKTLYSSNLHLNSWMLMHAGIYQFKHHNLIITNRLHGHILALILKIPHLFLPNSYYKNESFYSTWTHQIPFCKFVTKNTNINKELQELSTNFQSK